MFRPVFWSLLLVTVGVLLLLSNFNLIQFDIFDLLFRGWPLLLIAIGLDIILSGYRRRDRETEL